MRTSALAAGLSGVALLSACGNQATDLPLELQWEKGQRWHLATTYRLGEVRAETGAVDLTGEALPTLGEMWSDEVVWTFEVVEDGLVPRKGDELYPYAETKRGAVKELTVIRATVDPALNAADADLLASDPVVYLVFRKARGRLAAVVQFTETEDGQRLEQAFSSKDLDRSWAPLSQSMLTAAPTYLAPHGIRIDNGERKLENGAYMGLAKVDDETVDVTFDDELGGGIVAARYQVGQPWPTWTVGENVESRLLTGDDVSERMRSLPVLPPPPEDYDYEAALSASVDIDAALTLSETELSGGTETMGAPEGYRPWNGSWWQQSKGALVFGYDSRDTVSDRIQEEIDPLKRELDGLNEELRDLEQGTTEYDEKLAVYNEKQDELIEKLVAFYDGLQADLDGGTLRIEGTQLVHDEGWSYDLEELSPMDKVALSMYVNGETYPNPFYVSAWELLNHYSPAGGSWWGHCNGWSAAAILNDEPTETIVAPLGDTTVGYTAADLKGLLSETHYSTYSRFYGSRYYKDGDDRADLYPSAFHTLVTFYLRDQQVPLVFDTDSGEQVWNFPAYGADVVVTETTDEGLADLTNINTADFDALEALPGIGEVLADRIIEYREWNGPFQSVEELDEVDGIGEGTLEEVRPLVTVDPIERTFDVTAEVRFATDGVSEDHVDNGDPGLHGFTETYRYSLVTDEHGLVLRGEWANVEEHPDFAWVPYANTGSAGSSENPYLSQTSLDEAVGTSLSRL